MEARIAKLESDVEHIKTDISDLKADLRSLAGKSDSNFQTLSGKVDSNFQALSDKIDGNLKYILGVGATGFLVLFAAGFYAFERLEAMILALP